MSTPDRDVQTWLRLVSKNLYVRRRQLDTKAATVFSLSAMMGSLALSLYPNIQHDPIMVSLNGLFVVIIFVAMQLAVRAMHPAITGPGRPTEHELQHGVPMLTTFEHFRNMTEVEYAHAVRTVLSSQEKIHQSLGRDIHEVGAQLGRRYRQLWTAYVVFGIGQTVGLVLFVYTQWRMFT